MATPPHTPSRTFAGTAGSHVRAGSSAALSLLLAASVLAFTGAGTAHAASPTTASVGQSAARAGGQLHNGSFEEGSSGWRAKGVRERNLVVAGAGAGGTHAAVLPARRSPVMGDAPNRVTGVTAGERHVLVAKVRGTAPRVRARLVMRHLKDGKVVAAKRKRVVVGKRWRSVRVQLTATRDGGTMDVRIAAGGRRGHLVVDDVRVVRNAARTAPVSTPARPPARKPTPKPTATPSGASCGAQGKHAPRCGTLWGVYTLQGSNPETAVTDLESRVGRKFDLTLRYHDFSDHQHLGQFPDRYQRALGTERTLFLSWQARVGSTNKDIRWASIADGSYDRFITSAAQRLKAWQRPVIVAFDAEFDNITARKGSVTEYVRAYRRIVDMFRAQGVTNVAWAWVPTGYLGAGNDARTWGGYPGDAYVDWVGYDPYNFYRCNGTAWKSFERTIAPFYDWAVSKGLGDKPFLLSEYGTQFDASDPTRSRQWYADIPSVLPRYPNLKAMIRFDANGVVNNGNKCNLWLDNGRGMVDAFAAAGRAVGAAMRP